MALSPFPSEFLSPTSGCFSSSSVSFVILHPRARCSSSFKTLNFSGVSCSQRFIHLDTPESNSTKKKKRKPKPSFFDQIREKWSTKSTSLVKKLPWQEQEQTQKLSELIEEEEDEDDEGQRYQSFGAAVTESGIERNSSASFVPRNFVILAPWIHGNKTNKTQFDSLAGNLQSGLENDQAVNGFHKQDEHNVSSVFVRQPHNLENEVNFDCKREGVVEIEETPIGLSKTKVLGSEVNFDGKCEGVVEIDENPFGLSETSNLGSEVNFDGNCEGVVKIDENPIGLSEKKSTLLFEDAKRSTFDKNSSGIDREVQGFVDSRGKSVSVRLPWERGSDLGVNCNRLRNRNTMLAEKSIPEPELKRLRKVSLRMVERIKVGAAGVTQALVDSIHEKWKEDEVVKLKFEGLPTLNMKRTHEILESRTGGLVIWRSGGSVVLYRGMSYKFPCVQSYTKQNQVNMLDSNSSGNIVGDLTQRVGLKDSIGTRESLITISARYLKDLSKEEIMDLSELNHLLDELGPRFKDWSGPEPLPVDADLLPSVALGYKRPFRLLPHGVRHGLTNKQMTFCRRTARTMPPHFALGRNRELQGLAMAMVKLWERSSIAKIAIKRGVLNTCNERMAEELEILTGGTLLSRNKDYIVFYRGNDFLPPAVTKTLVEAQKQTILRQDEEEQARRNASTLIASNTNAAKGPLVAGTLAETMAATSRWGNQPTIEDIEKMKRDSALARHASLVRYLEKKLALAKGKVKKAEKALEKVQESLKPAELPTDLETISDEERFLFRKMGLSMKPYLVLGRRGIFDGTVENIHLHWKYRELVKIMVERKSFPQVKHIAISLEAESGGVLVSVDKTTKGYVIILYRGKNYQRPTAMRPKSLLTRRQALARSIELQRREALKYHISDLTERIKKLKSELEDMMTLKEIDEETFNSRMDNASDDDETDEDEEEEAYLETYDSSNEDSNDV